MKISAHHGFEEPFLRYYTHVADGSSAWCGRGGGELVVVDNVTDSPTFDGTEGLTSC